ncbi:hypothetical protein HYZ99_00805 [Candidatus Peregrinibacteria bacterium]|nr:hypothetical protein [Candidatus Peregrinibacteria bacterium]
MSQESALGLQPGDLFYAQYEKLWQKGAERTAAEEARYKDLRVELQIPDHYVVQEPEVASVTPERTNGHERKTHNGERNGHAHPIGSNGKPKIVHPFIAKSLSALPDANTPAFRRLLHEERIDFSSLRERLLPSRDVRRYNELMNALQPWLSRHALQCVFDGMTECDDIVQRLSSVYEPKSARGRLATLRSQDILSVAAGRHSIVGKGGEGTPLNTL